MKKQIFRNQVQIHFKNKHPRAGRVTQLVEHLFSKREALSENSSTNEKKKNEHPKEGADHGGVGAFSVRLLE
jgi:hypothetical protein